jgi:O-antigen/teichoic acid export membrane protein
VIFFFAAPLIAAFYDKPQLILVLRVLSVTLFFGAFNSIQNAVVARKMQFKKLFFSSLGAIVISGTVGIVMAYRGLGVWALVAQQITNQLLITVILWFTVKWRPRLLFSFERVKSLFSYGWKLLVSSLIDTLYLNLRSLIIGKMYNAEMLGFYNRGEQFPALIVTNINGSIQSVMLPALASQQDNRQRVKEMVRRSIVTSSFILFPMMVGVAVIAEPLVKILLTEKWLPCVPFLQIYCVSYSLWPIHTANLQAINALGRSDIFLKLEIIKKILGLAILGVTVFYGVYAIALGSIVNGLISTIINSFPNGKLLNYSYKEQWKDIMPSLLLSLVMGAVVYSVQLFGMIVWHTLIVQGFVGIILYVGMAKIFKLECFTYLLLTWKDILKNRKGASV